MLRVTKDRAAKFVDYVSAIGGIDKSNNFES